jgi:hypothetical protein
MARGGFEGKCPEKFSDGNANVSPAKMSPKIPAKIIDFPFPSWKKALALDARAKRLSFNIIIPDQE